MGDIGSRRGAANLAMPLMVISFALMAAFLWWLNGQAEMSAMSAVEPASADTMPAIAATAVTPDELLNVPQQFEGQLVAVSDLDVADVVGTQAFFLDLPQSPFLVKLDSTLVSQGETAPMGRVSVVGTMLAMNDSIVNDWITSGAIAAVDQLIVEFATHFIEAVRVSVQEPQGGSPGAGG